MRLLVFILSLVFLGISCQNQKPEEIEATSTKIFFTEERAEACRNTSFTENITTHSNVINLFKCAQWDKKFKNLFHGINNISSKNWNYISNRFDHKIFNDRAKRDRIFSLYKTLDKQNGLDDLSKVITALNDTNFYDALHYLYYCSEKKNEAECKKLNRKSVKKEDIEKYYQFFKFSQKDYDNFTSIVVDSSKALKNTNTLRNALMHLKADPEFLSLRINVVTQFLEHIKDGVLEPEREFVKNVMTSKNGSQNWIYSWLKGNNSRDFQKLIEYPYVDNKNLVYELKSVKYFLEKDLICKDSDKSIYISAMTSIDNFLNHLKNNDQKSYFDFTLQTLNVLNIAETFCPEIRHYAAKLKEPLYRGGKEIWYSIDFFKTLSKTSELMLNPVNFKLISFLNRSVTAEDKYYIIDSFSNDLFSSLVDLNKHISDEKSELWSELFKLLLRLSPSTYEKAGDIVLFMLNEKNEEIVKSVATVWNFFSEEEKSFFLRFIDKHFDKDVNYEILFDFYASMLTELKGEIPGFVNEFLEAENLSTTIDSIKDLVANLHGKDVLNDFKEFLSRDHILKIIEVISRGIQAPELSFEEVTSEEYSRLQAQMSQNSGTVISNDIAVIPEEYKKCVDDIAGKSFRDYLFYRADKCERFRETSLILDIMININEFNTTFCKIPIECQSKGLVTDSGLFSNAMIENSAIALKKISPKGNKIIKFIEYLNIKIVNNTQQYLTKMLSSFSTLINSGEEDFETAQIKILRSVSNFSKIEFKNYFNSVTNELKKFNDYLKTKDTKKVYSSISYVETRNCDVELTKKFGGVTCPSANQVNVVIERILRDLLVKNNDDGDGLDFLLDAVDPEKGLSIPFGRKPDWQKKYWLTLSETISMMTDLTDRENVTNRNLLVKYLPVDGADKLYFKNDFEEIYRKTLGEKPWPEEINIYPTTMERIESVIREVRFDVNYLGAHYMNSVASSINYDETVKEKKGLLKFCIPIEACGKFMNKAQERMGMNSIAVFDGLIDANIKEGWRYGDYMQTLLSVIVGSSSVKSQKYRIAGVRTSDEDEFEIPWIVLKKHLRHHNGKVLNHLSMISAFSNGGRFFRDRIGDYREVREFINKEEFKIIEKNLFKNFTNTLLRDSIRRMLEKIKNEKLYEEVVYFFRSLSYKELRVLENSLAKLVSVIHHFGVDEGDEKLDGLLVLTEVAVNNFIKFKKAIPKNYSLKKSIPYLMTISNYLFEKVVVEKNLETRNFVKNAIAVVNFFAGNEEIVTTYEKIITDEKKLKLVIETIENVFDLYNSLGTEIHEDLDLFLNELQEVVNFNLFNLDTVLSYIKINSIKSICSSETVCVQNDQFLEYRKILKLMTDEDTMYLIKIIRYFNKNKIPQLDQFFKDTIYHLNFSEI